MTHPLLDTAPEVAAALAAGRPVVALESTIISHGMPWPRNAETALAVQAEVRAHGAVPATIAVLDGRLQAGLSDEQIRQLGRLGPAAAKASRRDLPLLVAQRRSGATTVAATMIIAALAGIRVNEQRMRAAGFATYAYKLAAFVLAGALAGLAGGLLAVKDGYVNPELLSWHESGAVLLMIILGGIGHLRGAVVGAVAFVLLKELYATPALVGHTLAEHWQLTLGLTIIAFVAFLPSGLIGLRERLFGARA